MTAARAHRAIAGAAVAAAVLAGLAAAAAAQPKETKISYYYDAINQSLVRPATRALDPALLVRKLSGSKREASNVDANDQVRLPSTWWQPRLGHREVTVERMLKGPGPGTGPAPGKWKVVRAKTQGVTPGFQILDSEGQRFNIKFDPPKFPEMATGADVVCTYLYWAAGYNVPDNTIEYFRREDLEIGEGATFTDPLGRKHPITDEFLERRVLSRTTKGADGTYRCVASRFLAGKPLGEWRYDGRRKDDPEDLVPHQHRREIRGLWAINAFMNHVDCSARNTLDMWVTDGGRSFVRHHLIDFGACLGSASVDRHSYRTGHEYFVDYGVATHSLVTLGLTPFKWEDVHDPEIPAVGFFEDDAFDPEGWRPFLPNPAFDERTERDVRWGARIVAAFSDEHIQAAVAQAKYTDPRAAAYIAQTLMDRRDKLVRRWLGDDGAAAAGAGR